MLICGVQDPLKKTGRNLKPYEGNKIDTMKNYFSSFTGMLIFMVMAIALNSCNSENSKLETLKSLSTQGSRLIKNLKFDSVKIIKSADGKFRIEPKVEPPKPNIDDEICLYYRNYLLF